MNRVANTYSIDARLAAQRPATSRSISSTPVLTLAIELSREILGTRAEVRRRGGLLPSWSLFSMIILATLALCITVTMRTSAKMRLAEQDYRSMNAEVEALQRSNFTLQREVKRLHIDPRAIEATARARFSMVRADEIVVPVD